MSGILTPEYIASGGSESAHQKALMQWIAIEGRLKWPELRMLFAIPNGGDRSMSVAATMKAEGVKRGVPDLMLPVVDSVFRYHGLWIEMKKPGMQNKGGKIRSIVDGNNGLGGRSVEQQLWHMWLSNQQYAVAVCYSWIEAKDVLGLYMEGCLAMPSDGDAYCVT